MGTHPIFESDFDCLTDRLRLKMNYPSRLSRILVLGSRRASQKQPGEIFTGSYEEYIQVTAKREKLKAQNRFNKKDHLSTEGHRDRYENIEEFKTYREVEKYFARMQLLDNKQEQRIPFIQGYSKIDQNPNWMTQQNSEK